MQEKQANQSGPADKQHPWKVIAIWEKEWPIVKATPTASISCFSAGCLIVYLLYNIFIIPGKNAAIENLDRQVKNLSGDRRILNPSSVDYSKTSSSAGAPQLPNQQGGPTLDEQYKKAENIDEARLALICQQAFQEGNYPLAEKCYTNYVACGIDHTVRDIEPLHAYCVFVKNSNDPNRLDSFNSQLMEIVNNVKNKPDGSLGVWNHGKYNLGAMNRNLSMVRQKFKETDSEWSFIGDLVAQVQKIRENTERER